MVRRWIWLAVAVAVAVAALVAFGLRREPPARMEPVRVHVAPGLPGSLVAELAVGFGIARPTLVATVDEAEVAWLRDPVSVLALGDRAGPGTAPEQPRIPDAFVDPKRRFAPVGGIARVIVTRRPEPVAGEPDELRELADARLRGRVAMVALGRGDGPMLVAALELAYGERATQGWVKQLGASGPILLDDDAAVVASVADGEAEYGLANSLDAGADARLRIIFPDQGAKGCVVTPTAVVNLPGASPAARKFSAWLAGPTAEEVIAQRVVGLLPLREKALAPERVVPVWKLQALTVDWGALSERTGVWEARLHGWPGSDGPKR